MAGPSEIVPLRDVSEAAPEHAEVRPELAEVECCAEGAVPEKPLAPAATGRGGRPELPLELDGASVVSWHLPSTSWYPWGQEVGVAVAPSKVGWTTTESAAAHAPAVYTSQPAAWFGQSAPVLRLLWMPAAPEAKLPPTHQLLVDGQ